jgi:uncharacterized protein
MGQAKVKLELLPGAYAVCRLARDAPAPDWANGGAVSSITRTNDELSVVCPDTGVPAGVDKAGGWRVLKVEGPLDLSLTGVLASLASPLARAGISVFALSTYDTDYLLVKQEQLAMAIRTLRAEGYDIDEGYGRRGEGEEEE